MGAPTAPTANSIVTEALTRFANGATPDPTDITRATSYGLEKVKRDIMNLGKTWRPLLKTDYVFVTSSVTDYANPSDYEAYKGIQLMTGDHFGVNTAVTSASNITLAVTEDATATQADGKYLLSAAAAGSAQAKRIWSYNSTTKVAVLLEAYDTAPLTGDFYLIVKDFRPLVEMPAGIFSLFQYSWKTGTPVRYSPQENATVGFVRLSPVPNAYFGLRREYYADLVKLDITEGSTYLYTTILTQWASVFEQGVYVWALGQDDDRFQREYAVYQEMLMATAAADLVGFQPAAAPQGK